MFTFTTAFSAPSPTAEAAAAAAVLHCTGNPLANRALIDRICYVLESLYFPVQAAALELLRTLMSCDIADDILKALVELLHPQREIELSKLFKESTTVLPRRISNATNSDEEEEDQPISSSTDHHRRDGEFSLFSKNIAVTLFLCIMLES
ncbi:unnamed protein product [Rodentolepis nana]|uniref:TIP120 domain-containing protein n=1 Tax=Rodentolepis nana TaxID=102285 RepID=A0A0R3TVW2_RODNA|nr:unnamed protein product [Rodentolepis nana]